MIDIEKGLLSLLLRRGGDDCILKLQPQQFENKLHRKIFTAIKRLYFTEGKIDIAGIAAASKSATNLVNIVEYGDAFIGTKAELDKLVEMLDEQYTKRQLYVLLQDVQKKLSKNNAKEIKALLANELEKIETKAKDNGPVSLKEALLSTTNLIDEQYNRRKEGRTLETHLPDLNQYIGGLMPKDLILIGARPSTGKTALAMDFARHMARKGHKSLFVSLEMSKESLCMRYLAGESNIDTQKIRTAKLEDYDWPKLGKAMGLLSDLEIYIDDEARTLSDIMISAKETKAANGLDIIFVDYMQLVQPEGRTYNREQEIASISRGLKRMAMELEVPVVVLTQLNRDAEGQKPRLSNLRESGAQEQDADLVMFLWQPEDVEENWAQTKEDLERNNARLLQLSIAKQRNGPLGDVFMAYFPAKNRFINIARFYEMSESA